MLIAVERNGRIEAADGSLLAVRAPGNLLDDAWRLPDDEGSGRVVAWSGTLADELFEGHPGNWRRPGHETLHARCRKLRGDLTARGIELWLQPHARHVLSDVQSAIAFHRDHEGEPFGIAVDPVALLEPTMIADIDDHLRRTIETLGPVCPLVVLGDVVPTEGDGLRPVGLGRGILPGTPIRELLRKHAPWTTVAVMPEDLETARRWLDAAAHAP